MSFVRIVQTLGLLSWLSSAKANCFCGLLIDSLHPVFAHDITHPAIPGPAFNSGEIQEGDILCEVDGHSVLRCRLSQVAAHLLGPEESNVKVVFLRGEERIVVSLVRRSREHWSASKQPEFQATRVGPN